jgi:Leucine-rich repeat (LRR) protein
MPDETSIKPRRLWLRVSLRTLAMLVLVIGVWLGWTVRDARVQRQALNAIAQSNNEVEFGWVFYNGASSADELSVPDWLVDRLGVDYFGYVGSLAFGNSATDEDLLHVRRLRRLEGLDVRGSGRITDAGLARLSGLSNLRGLDLSETPVTDAGMAHLGGLTGLVELNRDDTAITDAGLVHIRPMKRMNVLSMSRSGITGAGLVHLQGFSKLRILNLNYCAISDSELVHLEKLRNLQIVYLHGTRVSSEGVRILKRSLPKAQIIRNMVRLDEAV